MEDPTVLVYDPVIEREETITIVYSFGLCLIVEIATSRYSSEYTVCSC